MSSNREPFWSMRRPFWIGFFDGLALGFLWRWLDVRRHDREWSAARQIEHLRVTVQQDARWLAHDPIASALCNRYAAMLASDWEKQPVEDISRFRASLGLDPLAARTHKETE